MSANQYAQCPCGSGKKLKFCKCIDNTQDYDKLLKLIEGGQGVAAIDRINQLLKKTPNAAWLLAIKGELCLGMQEMEMFAENATRFLKLKPDNPLALVMNSLAANFTNQEIRESANFLLEGMAEARESLPALTLAAIRLLLERLKGQGMTCLIGYWGELFQALTPEDQENRTFVLEDPDISLLAKSQPPIVGEDPHGDWNERLAEVSALYGAFRPGQAETKLRSLLRDFPNQPALLCHLLRTQLAQLDQWGAYDTARKLEAHEEVSQELRPYFGALALELEPEHKQLRITEFFKYGEIESDKACADQLRELDFVEEPPEELQASAREMFGRLVEDEVPATMVFRILDSAAPNPGEESEKFPMVAGMVALFGKQTDKPARALLTYYDHPASRDSGDKVFEKLSITKELSGVDFPNKSTYSDFLSRPTLITDPSQVPGIEVESARFVQEFLECSLPVLGGQTPAEAAKDDSKKHALASLLHHLEGDQSIIVESKAIQEIFDKLEVPRPPLHTAVDGKISIDNVLAFDRFNYEEMEPRFLKEVAIRSLEIGAQRAFLSVAKIIRSHDELAKDDQLQMIVLGNLLRFNVDINAKLTQLDELIGRMKALNQQVGRLVLEKVNILAALGREDDARATISQAFAESPDDPYLMSFLQYAQRSAQAPAQQPMGGDPLASKLMQNAMSKQAPPENAGGGIVLPGQEQAPAQGGGGESKLWLPGS